MSGGVGNYKHLIEGINHQRIDAASTAHLFNFIGDGLFKARESLLSQGVELAYWPDISSLTLNE
jgi:cyclase